MLNPAFSAIVDCSCGHDPVLVSRMGRYWYHCTRCGESAVKSTDIPEAARAWNELMQERRCR